MPTEASPFSARRSGGVRHPPEADIESIRDLLRGYGESRSILKELIQNAEDAGASRLIIIHSPQNISAQHPLLCGPGLLVANDGVFTQENRDAITQINLGTKGTEERAIGRFGKGLKSVFAWCEAFFIIARTDPTQGWPVEYIADLFNPWHGWRHADWEEEFDKSADRLTNEVGKRLANIYGEGSPWLAFWFPLRCKQHQGNVESPDGWIDNSMPGHDPDFAKNLAAELKSLAPSLVLLRNLKEISITGDGDRDQTSLVWDFPQKSQRIPAPDTAPGSVLHVNGTTTLRAENETEFRYCGFAGRLPDGHVEQLKRSDDWPRVVSRTHDQNHAGCPVKGEPHFATLLTWGNVNQDSSPGTLGVRWCVFFPVGKQPSGHGRIALPTIRRSITLNLHGFFFLDSERLRIDGLDDAFSLNGTIKRTCVEWNRLLATQGTLAKLPAAIAAFTHQASLSNPECHELAQAIRQTGVWSTFSKAVCHLETWRPRWRSGAEKWELIPATALVLLIPRISATAEVLARIPKLASLSESITLVACGGDGLLPGFHLGKEQQWTEDLVLQLLDGVELSPTSDEAVADWLSAFLCHLHDTEALTPAIRDRASTLPLLPVRVARTGSHMRVTSREWSATTGAGQLFALANPTAHWLRLLLAALPNWSCIIAYCNPPRWFTGHHPPVLHAQTAASAVLSQSGLGQFTALAELVRNFVSLPVLPDSLRFAIRYLMHGHAAHARNGEHFLFMPSTQPGELIWSRLIKQLLIHEGGENSWRLLHQQWASVLSPQSQQDLTVSTIDEQGAWEELMTAQANFSTLEFPASEWSPADVATLLHGLFQAGQSSPDATVALLRKLRLHKLRGQPNEGVSIAADAGRLSDLFVLHTLNFEASISSELMPLWERFLSTTKVVERVVDSLASTVQETLFRQTAADGEPYDARLDWNYVVRRCLESSDPCAWAPLIMEALSRGDQAVRGLGGKLKQTEWMPLSSSGSLAPDSIILIDGLADELHELLDPTEDGLAGTRALSPSVVEHAGFATLKKYFSNLEDALGLLGLWLKDKPGWHLGLTESSLPPELDKFLSSIENVSELPGAALLAKLWRLPSQAGNKEWDALLRETIWPSLLQSFAATQDGANRLERVLSQLATALSRIAFDAYLRQAVAISVVVPMLPRLSLVNQRGQWRPASQLIWPSANLDPAAQLCDEQDRILSALRVTPAQAAANPAHHPVQGHLDVRHNQLDAAPDFALQAQRLADYLKPFTTGNVGHNRPATLVAVSSGTPQMRALLQELLRAGQGLSPEDFLLNLLGENRDELVASVRSKKFLVEVISGDSTQAQTITGEMIPVALTPEIKTLVVGDASILWRRYFYRNDPETACHRLRLRWIERPDDLSDLDGIFASTIETILLKVHCNGVADLCPRNLKEVVSRQADEGQADLRRSQLYLLDMAEARLKELAVRGFPAFDDVLRQFADARQARVDAELMQAQAPSRAQAKLDHAKKLTSQARQALIGLLESPENANARRMLAEAIRRKMTDFQYSIDSVALELFQNADDAVTEWDEMKRDLLPHERQFVVHLDAAQRRLELIHWGRPINRHAFPGFSQGLKRGYDRDLQKMLTLNFSDKGVGDGDQPVMVTGRFGLGFKTVFFVADQPEVISGRLAFEIRGGFYPVPLPLNDAKALRQWADSLGVSGLVPTAIRLKWTQSTTAEKLSEAFDAFTQVAPLLAIFARRVRTLIVKNGDTTATFTSHEDKDKLTSSGRFTHIQVGQQSFLCFRCPLRADARPASVLLPLDASGVSALPEAMPRLWITTPTTEHSDLRWALNAPFKPDAGRQRLALNNPVNRQIAEDVAHAWLQSLLELYDATRMGWDEFARHLGLHSSASFATWWQQLWNEMTRTWPTTKWESLRDGGQVLGYIAWGQSTGAMLRLVQQRAAIPSQLLGVYAQFLKSEDAYFSVAGLIADQDNGCFALIAEWPSVQAAYPPGKTIAVPVAHFLKQVLSTQKLQGELNLRTALKAELGEKQEANHLIAERLGQLFLQCNALFQPASPYSPEVLPALTSLNQAKLLASDGQYHPATALVCPRSLAGIIGEDEADRAKFAPASAVLSSGYSDAALHFFMKARGQLAANAATLKGWVDQATSEQLPAIFQYLINGELGQQLADELGRPWLDTKRSTPAFQSLSVNDVNELERKFLRHHIWIPSPTPPTPITDTPAIQVMPADLAFRCVSEWWAREHATWIAIYENRTYPSGFPGTLPWPGEDEWDAAAAPSAQARWLLLFVHAALVPLGFNRIGRDQSFTRFLIENDWVDVLVRVSADPHALFAALDKYLGSYLQNTEFHFQMRQFIAFYAVSRNLDAFLHSLRAAENSIQPDAFNLVFSPNANPNLSGTGIVAPPLSGMLGMGTCQLLRELYRLGRLKNPHGFQFAFTPIRKVRRLCTQLFGTSEGYAGAFASVTIFSELQQLSAELQPTLDPTFKHCFDLPLQILAENKDLRTQVLQQEFEAEAADSIELDAAPRDFNCPTL